MAYAQTLAGDKGIKLYIDWHSYAQTILLSYGYSCDTFPQNYDQQVTLAGETAARIAQPCMANISYLSPWPSCVCGL